MPDIDVLLGFVVAVFILSVTPGPDFALIVSRAMGQGKASALLTVCGFALAGLIQVPLVAMGVGSLVDAYPILFDLIRVLGGAYLIWRGVNLLRHRDSPHGDLAEEIAIIPAHAVRDGFIASLTNPKGLMFMTALLPQFVDASGGNHGLQLLVFGLIMKLTAFLSEASIALAASAISRDLRRYPKLIVMQDRLSAMVMIGLGLHLAFRR
ncbi:MAG: LysE family translocator [Rhizobium sp.]|nr:LysE family translocator [Rhizobium sp.]